MSKVSPPFGRFTEPAPGDQAPAFVRYLLAFVAVGMTFILGGACCYFLLFHTPYLNGIKPASSVQNVQYPQEFMGGKTGLDGSPPRLPTPPPPRLQQHLKPQENEIEEIIDILRAQYMEPQTILVEQLDENALQQLVSAPDRFARLSVEPALSPIRGSRDLIETLPHNIAYWRPIRLEPENIKRLTQQWAVWKSGPATGLILDLRYFRDGNNYDGATSAASLFLSPELSLFSIQKLNMPQQVFQANRQPLEVARDFPIIILVNAFTRGAAEILAVTLRDKAQALVIGQSTAGEGGLYTENRLSSGRFLRLASARVNLSNGTDMLGRSVHPDISISVAPQKDWIAFVAGYSKQLNYLVDEPEVSRTEEISIEQETDAVKETLNRIDRTLQGAMDIIRAIQADRPLPTQLPESEPSTPQVSN
ncbi:MAG: S41 family peptidase [Verrucomicrobiota bacterium]